MLVPIAVVQHERPSIDSEGRLPTVRSTDRRNTLTCERRWSVMGHRSRRRFFTAAESSEIWDRWQKGEGLKSIGRALGKNGSSSIYNHLSPFGGIRPPLRRRS